jgi:hypothetical protein
VDPLRPFAELVRSLYRARSGATARTSPGAQPQGNQSESVAIDAIDALHTRLRARLSEAGLTDADRARKVFVEVVLAWELGDQIPGDPAFAEVVKAVTNRIADRPRLSGRLHTLLTTLVQNPSN